MGTNARVRVQDFRADCVKQQRVLNDEHTRVDFQLSVFGSCSYFRPAGPFDSYFDPGPRAALSLDDFFDSCPLHRKAASPTSRNALGCKGATAKRTQCYMRMPANLHIDAQRQLFARSQRVKGIDFHPTEPWVSWFKSQAFETKLIVRRSSRLSTMVRELGNELG